MEEKYLNSVRVIFLRHVKKNVTIEIEVNTDHSLIKWYELETLLINILRNYELLLIR